MAISVLRAVHSMGTADNQRHLLKSSKEMIPTSHGLIDGPRSMSTHLNPDNPYSMESRLIYRRKKSFYLLLSLLVLGIILLILIAAGSVIIYITYTSRVRMRIPIGRKDHCLSIGCSFGADCIFDEHGREPYCRCTHQCSPTTKDVVCGTDNVTYSSSCHLQLASCELQTSIQIKNEGICLSQRNKCLQKDCKFGAICQPLVAGGSDCRCPERCVEYSEVVEFLKNTLAKEASEAMATRSDPICGMDGKHYDNFCQLARIACETKRHIAVKYVGLCDPCKEITCPSNQICQLDDDRRPLCSCNQSCTIEMKDNGLNNGSVCASNGLLYPDGCSLQRDSCLSSLHFRIMDPSYCVLGNHPCHKMPCRYGSKCVMDQLGVARCECPSCSAIYNPVCGSDGRTYDSVCHLMQESCLKQTNLTISYHTICDHDQLILSSREGGLEPAGGHHCTADNCRFGGVCVVERPVGGPPRSVCECMKCPKEDDPVCGSDGATYASECQLRENSCKTQKSIYISHKGACRSCDQLKCKFYAICEANLYGVHECVCPQVCLRMDAPVCGSNGVTYDNECELRVRACRAQTDVTIAHLGLCDDCQTVTCRNGAQCEGGRCVCPSSCPNAVYEPICANDGNTYPNECEMRKNACLHDMDLRSLFYGHCEESEKDSALEYDSESKYQFDDSPIASRKQPLNDETPRSQAQLEEESCQGFQCPFGGTCRFDKLDGYRYCECDFRCPTASKPGKAANRPVCGSDRRLYQNECLMREASCRRQEAIRSVKGKNCNYSSLTNGH